MCVCVCMRVYVWLLDIAESAFEHVYISARGHLRMCSLTRMCSAESTFEHMYLSARGSCSLLRERRERESARARERERERERDGGREGWRARVREGERERERERERDGGREGEKGCEHLLSLA